MDRREAGETNYTTTFGSSTSSNEPSSSTTTTLQLLCSSSSNAIKTEIQKQQEVPRCDDDNSTNSGQFYRQEQETGLQYPATTTATTNSCNLSYSTKTTTTTTTTTGLEANDLDVPAPPPPPPTQITSLAKQLSRHLHAPLIKANIKRCHRKLANLQLHHYHHHHQQQQQQQQQRSQQLTLRDNSKHKKLLSSSSTVDLFKQCDLDNACLYEGAGPGSGERKSLVKNMQTTSDFYVDKNKKSPEKCNTSGGGLRQARRRKRLNFMRRSTKSAPG